MYAAYGTVMRYSKVGLIAGGGPLPHAVIAGARESGTDIFVASLKGFSDPDDFEGIDTDLFRLGEIGRLVKTLKSKKVEAICFAGIVKRPDFSALRPDARGLKYLPGVIKAATKGDDSLLRYVTQMFEKEKIAVIGPQEICKSLLAPSGVMGKVAPDNAQMEDAQKARKIAKDIGALDIGQGAVVSAGLVLAVEAQEGTDLMLQRVAQLPADHKNGANRSGVLAKMVKPGQEERIDLPVVGLNTLEGVKAAGLSGIVVEAGRAFIMDRVSLISQADDAGLFIIALEPEA